jgi:DNA-binding CsgD family transcriptional regulator
MRRGRGGIRRRLLPPAALDSQARLLLRVGGAFRWAAIGLVGVCAFALPEPRPLPGSIVPWMIAAGVYAVVLPAVSERLSPAGAAYVAWAILLADMASVLAVFAVYRGNPPDGFYVVAALLLLEAALVGGSRGAVAVGAVLTLAMGPLTLLLTVLFHSDPTWQEIGTDACSVGLLAIAIAVSKGMLSAEAGRSATPVAAGQTPAARVADAADVVRLTNRERQVLSLMASGYSNLMIASRLQVTESTVKGHVESIFARLNAHNRAEAVAVATRLHLIPADGTAVAG